MEQHQEENKCTSMVYKRSFPTGRILEGHMRVHLRHVAEKSVEEKVVGPVDIQTKDFFYGYVLRENPKKSCKFSAPVQETAVKCRFCGKEFESRNCLNGHLRHHSGKERNWVHCNLCWKRFKSVMSLAGHMKIHSEKYKFSSKSSAISKPPNPFMATLSDTETMNLVRKKRSKRMRYKFTPYPDFSSLNDSVCGLGINQDEEEVVVSLLMLSRGKGKNGWFTSEYDSLDSSLVSSENVSLSEAGYGGPYGDKPREEWLDSFEGGFQGDVGECDQIVRDQGKMILMEVEVDDVSEFMFGNNKKEKGFHNETNTNLTRVDPKEDLKEETLVDDVDLGFMKPVSSTKAESDPFENELEKGSSQKMVNASAYSEVENGLSKKCKFTCKICNRSFPTYQSLGGHQTYHRGRKGSMSMKIENHQHDIQTNSALEMEAASWRDKLGSTDQDRGEVTLESCESGINKEYRCLICCKNFVSGQALGGHKRAHFVKAKGKHIAPMGHECSDICNLVDTNLSDLLDAEANCSINSNSWWAGGSCDHEGLVGTLTN